MDWNTETQRHRVLFLREQSKQSKYLTLKTLPSLSIYFSPCLCVLLYYSRTKLVCEKWIGTQRHKGTEFYFFERTEFTVQSAGFMIFAFSI